jgi:enamine deaminase RidA (YjgF/YER057c/UK114 family)
LARSVRAPPRKPPRAGARARFSSGTPWEPTVGYSRAIRVGGHVYVSGTTAFLPDGSIVGLDDPYRQTVQVLDNIERALQALGSGREAIVRLRIFVTDKERVDRVTRALGERFRPIRPAMTLVVVPALLEPAMMVEIEADADDLPPSRG